MVNSPGVNGGERKRHRSNYRSATLVLSCQVMARPKHINPDGEIKRLVALVPVPVAQRLEREAKKRGVPVAVIVREKLSQVA